MSFTSVNSLRARIITSALLITLVVLPSIGIALNKAFEQQVRANVQDQLSAYFYSVLAVTEMDGGDLLMPEALLENQFNVINSGLYALVSSADSSRAKTPFYSDVSDTLLWFSNSFLGANINQSLPHPAVGESEFGQVMLNDELHFIFSYSVQFETSSAFEEQDGPSAAAPITLHIVKDLASVLAQEKAFSQQLWTGLLVLIVALLVIQAFWLTWTLKPLARFSQQLDAVQGGEREQLSEDYPKELNAVANQLNILLTNEQRQRKRYRNALADLAHSLKTPLAAVLSQKDLSAASTEQLKRINRSISHQLKRAQSAGTSAWHLGIQSKDLADKLIRTLAKIYPHIHLSYAQPPAKDTLFLGDEADLTEMLGNLLDNACKAAKRNVTLLIEKRDKRFFIIVEDDGDGVPNKEKALILERGKRADTYEQGHGIGLAIVRDLVESYDGDISIDASSSLGGAKFVLAFPIA